jgi:hypothetical protein
MRKLFLYLIIRLTTRHAATAVKIYESIYHKENYKLSPAPLKKKVVTPVDKKQEIIDSLKYLKSKTIQSKRDKGSISMLEGVLATMV